LLRKANSVVPRERVGNWLYGVAYQTAVRVRAEIARRRLRETPASAAPEPEAWRDPCADLRPLLDQELSRLPDRYRLPLVLCDLENRTRKEAARQLGWPEGTVSSRLARARALLARRLVRRGVTLSAGTWAALLAPQTAPAAALGRMATMGALSPRVVALAERV